MRKRLVCEAPIVLGMLLGIASHSAVADERCSQVVGDWSWFIGGKVAFAPTGTVRWTPGVSTVPPATGTWTCVPETGTLKVTWQNGFIDTLNLAANGTQLKGVSSTGVQVSGYRAGAANSGTANSAGKSSTPTQNQQQTQDGWKAIGNAGFGKQSTVPIGPNGPQRIGPQGRPPPKSAG
jgi:hypothetical protein